MIWWSTNIHQSSQNLIWDSSYETHTFLDQLGLDEWHGIGSQAPHFMISPLGSLRKVKYDGSALKHFDPEVMDKDRICFLRCLVYGKDFLGVYWDTVYWSCSVMGSQWKSPFLMFRLTTRSFGLPHLFTLQLWLDSWEITLRNPLASVAMNHHTFQ